MNFRTLFWAVLFLAPASAWAQSFDNRSVMALHEAGLGEEAIVSKINSLPCGYDVSTDGLIALKKAGLTDGVIAAMVNRCTASSRAQGLDNNSSDPNVKHAPGIYVAESWLTPPRLTVLRPVVGSGNRATGNGSILFPFKNLLVIPQSASQTVAYNSRPSFYFYFDSADSKVSDFGTERSIAAQSPAEFTLIRFRIKGNSREVEVGRVSAYFSVDARSGVNEKSMVPFSTEEIGDGIYKVTPTSEMLVGEYAFVFSVNGGRSRVYDFSIQNTSPPQASKR